MCIVFQQGLAYFATNQGFLKQQNKLSLSLVHLVEIAAYVVVLLAILVLYNQTQNNINMDRLSGIEIFALDY